MKKKIKKITLGKFKVAKINFSEKVIGGSNKIGCRWTMHPTGCNCNSRNYESDFCDQD